MPKVQHPSGAPTYDVADPTVYLAAGWRILPESEWDGLTVPQLRELAKDRRIDLAGATRRADVIAAISAASAAPEEQ